MAPGLACFSGLEDKVKRIEKRESQVLAEMNALERRIQQQNYMAGCAYYEQNDLFAARKCWKTNKVLRTRYNRLDTKLVKLQNKRTRLGLTPSGAANRAAPIVVVDARTHQAFRNAVVDNKDTVAMVKVVNQLANLRTAEPGPAVFVPVPMKEMNFRGKVGGPGATGYGFGGQPRGAVAMQVDAFEQDDEGPFANFDMEIDEEPSDKKEAAEKMMTN